MNEGPVQLENRTVEKHNFLTGFSMVELIIVLVIIGILVSFALPQFAVTKERALDKEARANLSLIQAAEKIYKMESGFYYPSAASENNITNINTFLKVNMPAALSWAYEVDGVDNEAIASRLPSGRVWTLIYSGSTASCSGSGCP